MDIKSIALTPVPVEVVPVNGYLALIVDPEDILSNDDAPEILVDLLTRIGRPGKCLMTPDQVLRLAERAYELNPTVKLCLTTELVKVRS